MKSDYIEYRIKSTPRVWEQNINKDLVDKLFIMLDGQISTSRFIYCYTRTHYASYGIKYNEKLY